MLNPVDERPRLELQAELPAREVRHASRWSLELARRVGPENAVVHVPNVAANPEPFLHEPIEPAQIEIREMLRGQAADRQSTSPGVVSWLCDDSPKRSKQHPILEQPLQPRLQNGHGRCCQSISGHRVSKRSETAVRTGGPGSRRRPVPCRAAGKRVGNQPPLEDRLANVHDRVVQDPLAKAGRGDQPLLGIEDRELMVNLPAESSPRVRVVRHPRQIVVQARDEGPGVRLRALPSSALPTAMRRFSRSMIRSKRCPARRTRLASVPLLFEEIQQPRSVLLDPGVAHARDLLHGALVVARDWTIWASCSLVNTM